MKNPVHLLRLTFHGLWVILFQIWFLLDPSSYPPLVRLKFLPLERRKGVLGWEYLFMCVNGDSEVLWVCTPYCSLMGFLLYINQPLLKYGRNIFDIKCTLFSHLINVLVPYICMYGTRKWCIWIAREYWKIYRGPDFLAVIWFGSSPTPFSMLARWHTGRLRKRDNLPRWRWEEPNHTMPRKPGPL